MNRTVRVTLLLALSLGCDIEKSSLGGLPDTDGQTGSVTEVGETAGSITESSGAEAGDLGAPCDLSFFPETRLLDSGNAGCAAGMCLYAVDEIPEQAACTDDSDCTSPNGPGRTRCGPESGECELEPDFVAERSMCSAYCEDDSDCVSAVGTTCETGFSCGIVATLGPDCCQKVCVCNEDASVFDEELANECEQGVAAGCCDQTPTPAACM